MKIVSGYAHDENMCTYSKVEVQTINLFDLRRMAGCVTYRPCHKDWGKLRLKGSYVDAQIVSQLPHTVFVVAHQLGKVLMMRILWRRIAWNRWVIHSWWGESESYGFHDSFYLLGLEVDRQPNRIAGATAATGSIWGWSRILLIDVFPVAGHAQEFFKSELELLLLLFIVILANDPRVALHVFGTH